MKLLLVVFISSLHMLVFHKSVADGHSVDGETYACLYGDTERKIKVVYFEAGSKVPCEVIYEKDTETQVLWSANNVEGYCESKMATFVEKQRNWGWDCVKMEAAEGNL